MYFLIVIKFVPVLCVCTGYQTSFFTHTLTVKSKEGFFRILIFFKENLELKCKYIPTSLL